MLMITLSIEAYLLSLSGLEDIIDISGTNGGGLLWMHHLEVRGYLTLWKK